MEAVKKLQMVDLGSQYKRIKQEIDKAIMDVVRLETDHNVGPLRIVSGKRAVAVVDTVGLTQQLPIVGLCDGRGRNECRLHIVVNAARDF